MKSADRIKMFSTVWTIFTWLFLFVAVFGEKTETVLMVMAGLGLMTLLATFMIVRSVGVSALIDDQSLELKAKHGDMALIDRLIESMSEAEMAALRKRLIGNGSDVGDDGEIVSLDELTACSPISRDDRFPFQGKNGIFHRPSITVANSQTDPLPVDSPNHESRCSSS